MVPVETLTFWSQWLLQILVIQMPRLGTVSLSFSPEDCPWATLLAPPGECFWNGDTDHSRLVGSQDGLRTEVEAASHFHRV